MTLGPLNNPTPPLPAPHHRAGLTIPRLPAGRRPCRAGRSRASSFPIASRGGDFQKAKRHTMKTTSKNHESSLILHPHIQPPADLPPYPQPLGFELKPIVPPSPWGPALDRKEFEELVGGDVLIPADPYSVVPAVLAQTRARFQATLDRALRFFLATNREQAKVAMLLPLTRQVEFLHELVRLRPPADPEEVEAMAEAFQLVKFCLREYERIALRFALLGRQVTLFELALAENWLFTAADQLGERVYFAYPEVGREITTGEELDDEAEDELAAA